MIGDGRVNATGERKSEMIVVQDTPTADCLNTVTMMKNKQPLFFGGIEIKKSCVSFHVFPVCMFPEPLQLQED